MPCRNDEYCNILYSGPAHSIGSLSTKYSPVTTHRNQVCRVPCRGTHRTHASCWLVPSLMRNLIFVQRRDLRTKHNCDLRKRGEAETSFPTERRALDLFAPRPRQSASSVAHQMDPNCSKDSPKTCTRQHRPNAAAEPHPRSSLTPRRPQDRTQPWCLTLVIPRGCSPRRRSSCS